MAKYLRKYNKITGQWESITTTYSSDVILTNPKYSLTSGSPQTLDSVLDGINDDIVKLKQNVSWLAEHGGGGNGLGGGGSSASYKFFVENGGNGDTLYVSTTPYTIQFKIIGGSASDKVTYTVTYDGRALVGNGKECKVNALQTVVIPDFTEGVSVHSLQFEGIDQDGMMIEPRIINIMESSLKIKLNSDVYRYAITDSGDFTVSVTNKAINSPTFITVTNLLNGNFKNFQFTTQGVGEEDFMFNLFDGESEDKKIISNVEVGRKYTLSISATTETSNGIVINSNVLYPEIWFTSSNEFAIVVEGLTPYSDIIDGIATPKIVELDSNLSFAFTVYHGSVPNIYYAIVISKEEGETRLLDDIEIYGDYYATNEKDLHDSVDGSYIIQSTGAIRRIQFSIPNSDSYLGDRFVKIKCWSTDFTLSAKSINQVTFVQSNLEVFTLQKPKRSANGEEGHCLYMDFDMFTQELDNRAPLNGAATSWTTIQKNYLGYDPTTNRTNVWAPATTMNLYATNGLQSGFISKNNINVLRFQGDSYAKIANPFESTTDKAKLTSYGCFVLSLAYKTDEHPTNNKTVFEWCQYDNNGNVSQGIKVSLEKIEWELYSKRNGQTSKVPLSVNIQQNVDTAIDFVFIGSNATATGEKGLAKIFVNGVINAAVEVGEMDTDFCNDMFIACSNKNIGQGDVLCDYADIDFYSLRLFTGELSDIELIINSHNSIAERSETGSIDNEKYKGWKNRNFLTIDSITQKPKSLIYDSSLKKYKSVSFTELQNLTPLPILYINASNSQNSNYTFNEDFFYKSYTETSITSETFTNCTLEYYDNEAKKSVITDNVAISLQGTSSVTYRSKNLEIYFQKECTYDSSKTQLFQPRADWFPESQFTLKADIVDSAHANNAVLGQWINELSAKGFMKPTPAEELIEKMPPADKVVYDNNGTEEILNHNPGENSTWANHQGLKIKNTLEGFPVLLLIKFNPNGMVGAATSEQLMGIYSFNLGRYSYYNLGLKFFKYFSRRKLTNGKFENHSCPAMVDYYDFYTKSETIEKDGFKLFPKDFVSFEFGGGADENNEEYATWSQYDLSILNKIGSFRFHGAGDYPDQSPSASESVVNAWHNLRNLFQTTSRCLPLSPVYSYDSETKAYIPQLVGGNKQIHTDGGDANYQKLVQQLCIDNSMVYFVVCSVFGMVDSLGKNFTLRSWNCDTTKINETVWYPCFYDMDTALGLTNEGEEIVSYDAYIDKYYNTPIKWVDDKPENVNQLDVELNFSSEGEQNRYGGYNSKLWRILRKKNDTSMKLPWKEKNAASLGSHFKQRSQYDGYFYEEVYRDMRKSGGVLENVEKFIEKFTGQTAQCGEIIFNFDYTLKYLSKYTYKQGETDVIGLGNIKLLHGNRKEYVRNWLHNRLLFLDGVFEIDAYGVIGKPISQSGSFTFAGNPTKSPKPYFTMMVTNPAFLNVSVGQSGENLVRYYMKPYEETTIVVEDTSSTKQLTINNNTLITKFDGLKDYRLNKFETLNLPKLTAIDFSNITTFYKGTPIQFHTVFTFDTGIIDAEKRRVFSSNVREINLSNAKQNGESDENYSGTFTMLLNTEGIGGNGEKIVYNFDRLKKINIFNSCVSQLVLPSTILEELDVRKSDITFLNVKNQPLLTTIDTTGCSKLIGIEIDTCVQLSGLSFNGMTELTSVTISNCENITNISLTGNSKLQKIVISDCPKLTSVNLNGNVHQSLEVNILTCNNIKTFSASGLKTTKRLTLPLQVKNITSFNITGWEGLEEIQYGANSSRYEEYNETVGGVHELYTDGDETYPVLDLSPMTKITSMSSTNGKTSHFYKDLISSTLNLKNCYSVKTIKFRNDIEKPFVLNITSAFNGCTVLRRVFGHVVLHGNSDFNGNKYFQIHSNTVVNEKTVNGVVTYDKADFSKFKTGQFVTNFRLCNYSVSLTSTFANTSCSLYDAYYILSKCSKEGNKVIHNSKGYYGDDISYQTISLVFQNCSNIEFTAKNNLHRDTYLNCKVTKTFSNPFEDCKGNTNIRYYQPSGSTHGTLTPILENGLTDLNNIYGYGTRDIFKLSGGKVNTLTSITWSDITYVNDATVSSPTPIYVADKDIFKDLPKLKKISYCFNNTLMVAFEPETIWVKPLEGDVIQSANKCTMLLFNLPDLEIIDNSFKAIKCSSDSDKSQIRNVFGYGGYKEGYDSANNTVRPIYPQRLREVVASFIFGEPETSGVYPRFYLTNDLFSNIKGTLEYFSSAKINTCSPSLFPFSGKIAKYIPSNQPFPYEILSGCVAIKEIPGLFSYLKTLNEDGLDNVTIPMYTKTGNSLSMFKDCTLLTNIGYFFYDMDNIGYSLNGFGFTNCSLINVEKCFGYSAHHKFSSTIPKRRKGMIPYGLFYQQSTKTKDAIVGFTEEQATILGINEISGIKNPEYDENGRVKKTPKFSTTAFDTKTGLPLLLGGGTLPDSNFVYEVKNVLNPNKPYKLNFKYKTNDYGIILDGLGCKEEIGENEENQITTGLTEFKLTYEANKETIENMNGCFQYNDGDNLESYVLDEKKIDEKALIVDNDNYNTIKYLVNSEYNPILYTKTYDSDSEIGTWVLNPKYDPRRYIFNEEWNKYPKKVNKFYHDGVTDCSSFLVSDEIDPTSIEEINTYHSIASPISESIYVSETDDFLNGYVSNRYFAFAPDLLLSCRNDGILNIKGLFLNAGGQAINLWKQDSSRFRYLKYGIRGTLPPCMFEKLTNLTTLDNVFKGCRGLLPDAWGAADSELKVFTEGRIFPKDLFKNNKNINSMVGTFSELVFYASTYLRPNNDADEHLFAGLTKLKDMNECFSLTAWFGGETIYNPLHTNTKFKDLGINRDQLANNPFESLRNLENVKRMFYGGIENGDSTPLRTDLQCFNNELFKNNTKINNAEEIFRGCYRLTEVNENELIKFWDNKVFSTNPTVTKCYGTCVALKKQLENNNKWNDNFERYFNV